MKLSQANKGKRKIDLRGRVPMPAVRTRPGVRPSIRLRAVPPLDPPFDDESAVATWPPPSVDQLALDLWAQRPAVGRSGSVRTRDGTARGGDPATGVTTARAGAGGPGVDRLAPNGTGPPPAALATASPEAKQAAHRFLGRCLEILNGYRPVGHIRPLSAPADAAGVLERVGAAVRRLTVPAARPRRPIAPIRLRRLRVCEPRPGVAEIAAVLGRADRAWALTLRLERRRGSWVATTLQLL
jgi:hypothetical protein